MRSFFNTGMNFNWCSQPEIGLPKPDLVIFLNINPENQKNRPGFGTERYETLAIQQKVTEIFHDFAKSEDNWQVLDANQTFDKIHSNMLHNIEEKIKNIAKYNTPLQYFVDFNNDKENKSINNRLNVENGLKD